MTIVLQIIGFLIEAEPQIQQGVLDVVKIIKDAHDKTITAEQAAGAMNAAVGLMFGRLADPKAESAGINAAADAALAQKFKP